MIGYGLPLLTILLRHCKPAGGFWEQMLCEIKKTPLRNESLQVELASSSGII